MEIVCLDLEGVLVPEIWIAFAEASGIPELKKTTRDEPDYAKLMNYRIAILKEHGLGLKEIQETIAKIDPMPGAKEFLDELRSLTQVIIISDTFNQFATPLMKKLGWPTIFCNTLEVADNGEITGFRMRIEKSKYTTVKALQSIGYDTIASGDSYNDLGMIKASKAGCKIIHQRYCRLPVPHCDIIIMRKTAGSARIGGFFYVRKRKGIRLTFLANNCPLHIVIKGSFVHFAAPYTSAAFQVSGSTA